MLKKFAAVILIDQITKALFAHRDFFLGPIHFHSVKNYGLSFGLNNADPQVATILVGIILVGFTFYFLKHQRNSTPMLVVIAAAVSNFSDRLYFGAVRDFIDIGAFTFNLADMFIAVALFFMLFVHRRSFYSDRVGG